MISDMWVQRLNTTSPFPGIDCYTEGEREKDIEKVYTKSWKQVLQIMSEPWRSNQKHLGYLLILLFHNPTEDEKTWLPGIGAVLGKEIIIISIT